jgi:hypothetical protein
MVPRFSLRRKQFLAPRFFHIWFMPLIPLGRQLELFQEGKNCRFHPQPFSGRSLLAALPRTWGVLFVLFPGIPLVFDAVANPIFGHTLRVMLAFVLLVAAVAALFSRLGSLSPAEETQRMV